MRVSCLIRLTLSEPNAGMVSYFAHPANEQPAQSDAFTAQCSSSFVLPGTLQAVPVSFADLDTVAGIYVEADQAAVLTLNGQVGMTLTPLTGAGTARFLMTGAITSASLASATAGVEVTGRLCAWGYAVSGA